MHHGYFRSELKEIRIHRKWSSNNRFKIHGSIVNDIPHVE